MCRKPFLFLAALAVPFALSGCGVGQARIEQEVKKGMEEKLHVRVKSLTLNQESGDKYTGTAETTAGDRYEVSVTVQGNRIEWRAQPDQAGLEKQVRQGIEGQNPAVKVISVQLTKGADGSYTGEAKLNNGQTMKITGKWEGTQFILGWEPVPPGR